MNLDDQARLLQLDQQDMLGHIDALADQLAAAWARGQSLDLPAALGGVDQVVIAGMGGSAISGSLLAAVTAGSCHVPLNVVRSYDLPTYVDGPNALVITLSHSGNTEETLSAARQAIARGTRLLSISTGGELTELVGASGGTAWTYSYDSEPRAALGWLYGLLLAATSRLHLIDDMSAQVSEAVTILRKGRTAFSASVLTVENPTKRLAGQFMGRIPVIWGGGLLAPVARRWKAQFNENAKHFAVYDTVPELNHNSVVGLEHPEALITGLSVIQLISPKYDHPRMAARHRLCAELVLQAGTMVDQVIARGEGRLAQQMHVIQFGDYVSYYVALANGVDPTPIEAIAWLKEQLAAEGN